MIRRIVLAAFCGMFLFNLNAVAAEWGKCKPYDEYLEARGVGKCALCNAETDGYYACVYGRVQVRGWGGVQTENYCFRCDKGTVDAKWEKSGPITECAHDPLIMDKHAMIGLHDPNYNNRYYYIRDGNTTSFGRYKLCYVHFCQGGYKNVEGECVPESASVASTSAKKTTKSTPAATKKTTTSTPKVVYKTKTVVQPVASSNSSTSGKQKDCEDSGGTWSKKKCSCASEKYLVYNDAIKGCACDIGYVRDIQTNRCVATSQTQCEHVGPSVANWIDGKCVCVDTDKIWSSNGCILNPDKIMCDRISDAKWTGTECKCTIAGYVVNKARTQCVKSDELIKTEGQAASRATITSVYKKLNAMSDDFKVSVWKNADGNFNTARLASDSIAAVVLGTTGALVTSNIVKKNQVSGGFEDINCQVGGQTVAGWGDQFSVGIQ